MLEGMPLLMRSSPPGTPNGTPLALCPVITRAQSTQVYRVSLSQGRGRRPDLERPPNGLERFGEKCRDLPRDERKCHAIRTCIDAASVRINQRYKEAAPSWWWCRTATSEGRGRGCKGWIIRRFGTTTVLAGHDPMRTPGPRRPRRGSVQR